jgi:hypothetical protein
MNGRRPRDARRARTRTTRTGLEAPVGRPEEEPAPDIADEAGPKTTEFEKASDAKQMTRGDFDRIP